MDYTFVTIAEAARLTGQSDFTIMRAIKDYLQQSGVQGEEILRKEPRDNGFIYLVNKEVLLRELVSQREMSHRDTKEKESPAGGQETKETAVPEQTLLQAKNEMIATLQKVLDTKDRQIEDLSKKMDQLIERDRETNILLKSLQDKIFLLEQARPQASQRGENKKQA